MVRTLQVSSSHLPPHPAGQGRGGGVALPTCRCWASSKQRAQSRQRTARCQRTHSPLCACTNQGWLEYASQACADKLDFLDACKDFKQRCEPLFLLFRVSLCSLSNNTLLTAARQIRARQQTSQSADAALGTAPSVAQTEPLGVCVCVCVFVCGVLQNGSLKARIEGANTPLLNSQILALTPANAGIDDLEVCSHTHTQRAHVTHT